MGNRIDEELRRLKREQGIGVPKFADACGVPAQTIYHARKNEDMGKISVETFLKIAHAPGMTVEELYGTR